MSRTKPWFRLYSEISKDPKMRRLTPEERWLWIALLCAAWKSPVRGHLLISEGIPYEIQDMADEAAVEPNIVEKALSKFEALNMMRREGDTWVVTNFKKRQYDKKSDWPENTRTRKRNQREREKQGSAAVAGGTTAAVLEKEDTASDEHSSTAAPASDTGITKENGSYAENDESATLKSHQDSSTEKEGNHSRVTRVSHPGHAQCQSTVTPVPRGNIASVTRDIEEAGGNYDSPSFDESPAPAGHGVCTYPVRYQESSRLIPGHAVVTPMPPQSKSAYFGTSNYISSDYKYIHADDVIKNNKQQHHVSKENAQRETLIPLTLQQEFARPISPSEVDRLLTYLRGGMASEVICDAIRRAAIQGSPKVAYVEGILKNWWAQGVRDMAGVVRADKEFKERKKARGGVTSGQTNRGQDRSNSAQDPPKLKYAGLIPTFG